VTVQAPVGVAHIFFSSAKVVGFGLIQNVAGSGLPTATALIGAARSRWTSAPLLENQSRDQVA
jgi:hypothetical protein